MTWLCKRRQDNYAHEEELVNKRPCEYSSVSECPYSDPEMCKFDKTNCLLAMELKNKKPKRNTTQALWIIALGSLLIYTFVVLSTALWSNHYLSYLLNIISGLSLSIFAGSVLALLVDIPTRIQEYEASFVNALSSNNYLKTLDETRLSNLRNDVTEQLHKSKAPKMARGLINLDQKILDLLRLPYYNYYRHSVQCNTSEDGLLYVKEHIIEYKLINPYGVNRKATEYIRMLNLVLANGNNEDAVTDLKIECQIDDGQIEHLEYKSYFDSEPRKGEFYDTAVRLYEKDLQGKPKKDIEGIKVEFSDNIKVKMSYKIKVAKGDPCFTKRLQHPAQNFRLDYQCADADVALYGQIFGTELKQSDISINYKDDKRSISLETFDWLLPKNGAMVVM